MGSAFKRPLRWLLTISTILCAAAHADSAIPRVVTSGAAPWGFVEGPNKDLGILVDFQKVLFERAGIPFKNHVEPYPRVIQDIASEKADVALMFVSPQAAKIGVSLGQVVSENIIVVTRADYRDVISLDDFTGLPVGHIRGSKYGKGFDEHQGIIHTPVSTVEQGLRMLLAGRIEAMASTEHSMLYAMYANGIESEKVRIAIPLFTVRADLYVTHAAANEPWVAPLKLALDSMRKDGSIKEALYQRHYWPYNSFCFAGGQCLELD